MPRNRSELIPQYSPPVTAWLIAWHRYTVIRDITFSEETRFYDAMSPDERQHWGKLPAFELDPLVKQVYDAQK